MKAHVIENNVVTNTIEVDSLDFMPNLVEAAEGGVGWSYADGVFTAPADTRTDVEKADQIRAERDAKLAATDWTASTDVTMTAEMTAYRQSLRDVPAQAGFPNTINWPTEP
tara:strand:- start:27 stop:359 length:333 start_codon:yes stop_codon:yes gene_type:complete